MFCPKCGKEINNKSRFCMNCGCDINEYSVVEQKPMSQSLSEQEISAAEAEKKRREIFAQEAIAKYKSEENAGKLIRKRKRKAGLSFLAIILILILIGGGIYALTQEYTPKQMLELVKCKAERLIYYNKPEGAVVSYIDALKSMDMKKMDKYSANPDFDIFGSEEEEYNRVFFSYICELNKDICYKLVDSKVEGNTAEVRVTFEYHDASEFISEVLEAYFAEAVERIISLEGTTEEDMSNILMEILNEKIETANVMDTNRTITVYCEMKDNKWYISENNRGLMDVGTANMYTVIETMVDAYTSILEEEE